MRVEFIERVWAPFFSSFGSKPVSFFFYLFREVNNRLTGWTFAHPVYKVAHAVNSTWTLPKIAHPVNCLAQKKIGPTIICINKQFRRKFLHIWLNPKGESPLEHNKNRKSLTAVLSLNLDIIKCIMLCVRRWFYWKGDVSLRFQGKLKNGLVYF